MNSPLSVAVPWSLSHYISLNGFHPLYRALFETKPDWVQLAAWDNIQLSQKLRGDERFQSEILREVQRDTEAHKRCATHIDEEYHAHFWAPNQALTRLLPGDIEFHHTAPFPSLERPFVFHCESFAPVFFPFAHQGSGNLSASQALRAHYRAIFEHPLCLGISSHLSQTLEDLSLFFGSPIIDERLFASRIGLHTREVEQPPIAKGSLDAPIFLFINSAHQNPRNFFLRGGHLALCYWQSVYPEPGAGRLIMRCTRPTDALLKEHGVDLDWLRRQERHSVIWIEDYLSAADLDALMQAAHFLLLPSASLHSVSIMQAMAAGAVPVVTDTLGTDRYVTDAVDSIVLQGIFASNWHRDPETGVMIDRYQRNPELDSSLVQQLVARLDDLLADPICYRNMQAAATAKASEAFSGKAFSEDFWQQVQQRYQALPESARRLVKPLSKPLGLGYCLLDQSDWARIFTSPPQPVERLNTGLGRVTELGGCFVSMPAHFSMQLHDWSPIAEHVDGTVPSLIFAADMRALDGGYLGASYRTPSKFVRRRLVEYVAHQLMPYPRLYSAAASLLKHLRRIRLAIRHFIPSQALSMDTDVSSRLPDIQLIKQGVKGLNIIRCGDQFYAAPESAGAFSFERAQAGGYEHYIRGANLKEVFMKVDALPTQTVEDTELIEQNVLGFNIIRYGRDFYAIPMSDGAFDIARVQVGQYSRMHSGNSVGAVRDAIYGSVS